MEQKYTDAQGTERTYAVALGFFDGVHLAHRQVLAAARRYADAHGLRAAALTFDRHPGSALSGIAVPLLQTPEERADMLRGAGMDEVFTLPFDDVLRRLPWEAFLSDILFSRLGACFVAAGYDYRFGQGGQGDAEKLRAFCARAGVGCAVVGLTSVGGQPVGSTVIRGLLAKGEVETARLFLGRPHAVSGEVIHGKALGRTIDLPTMNIRVPEGIAAPQNGVYVTRTLLEGAYHPSMTNVADRAPVFGAGPGDSERHCSLETHVLDYAGDAYEKHIRVEFLRRLRGMVRFDSLAALQSQLAADRRAAALYFSYGMQNTPTVKERNEWVF